MKILKFASIVLLCSLFVLSGCDKAPEEIITPKFLVDSEKHQPAMTFDKEAIKLLLKQYGMAQLEGLVNYNFNVYKITYKTAFMGDTILASGIVSVPVPVGKKEIFPMMSFQHPTLVKKADAPSVNIDMQQITYLASTGMVIMVPDYIGFGESANVFHPYLHKEYSNNAIIDFIRATKEFIGTEKPCDINEKLFLFGYSQGGGATMGALSAIENNPANSDIKVTASSCGSGAYELNEFRSWLVEQDRYQSPHLLAYILESFSKYSNLNTAYSLVFSPQIAPKIPGIIDGIAGEAQINASIGTTHVGEMLNDNFETDSIYENTDVDKNNDAYKSMRKAFDDNNIEAWPIKSALNIYFGSADFTIPSSQSIKLYQDFQTLNVGTQVKLNPQDDKDHVSAFVPTLVETIIWFKSL